MSHTPYDNFVPHEELAQEVAESRNPRLEHKVAIRYAVTRLNTLASVPMRPQDQKKFAEDTLHGVKTILVLKATFGG